MEEIKLSLNNLTEKEREQLLDLIKKASQPDPKEIEKRNLTKELNDNLYNFYGNDAETLERYSKTISVIKKYNEKIINDLIDNGYNVEITTDPEICFKRKIDTDYDFTKDINNIFKGVWKEKMKLILYLPICKESSKEYTSIWSWQFIDFQDSIETKQRILNELQRYCFAPEDILRKCFEEWGDEIFNGKYIPIGISISDYKRILNKLRKEYNFEEVE